MLFQVYHRVRKIGVHLLLFILAGALSSSALAANPPAFSLNFSPATIGPGSIATLQYTISNSEFTPVTDLAFINTLPTGMSIATPAKAMSTCDGTLTAPDAGTTLTFSDGKLDAYSSCTISVNVSATVTGNYQNTTGELTSSEGNSDTATGDLIVAADRPGFSKSFLPASIPLGGRSTLTFSIDNSANPGMVYNLRFTDILPVGMIVANPANTSTTCDAGILTALPDTGNISFTNSFVTQYSSCTGSVDVTATSTGVLGNTSEELISFTPTAGSINSGKSGATLEAIAATLHLDQSFTNDPVLPDSTVELEFTISSFERSSSVTAISFSNDLNNALPGLMAMDLPRNDVCGAGSQISGQSILSFTGGNLGAGESCTFSVTLSIPVAAPTGSYPNTTSIVSAEVNGTTKTFPAAGETLFINEAPILSIEYLTDPVGAGGTATLEITINNPSPDFSATEIGFINELTTFLPFPVSVTFPTTGTFCGGASISLTYPEVDRQSLSMTGGTLLPGTGCTFEIDIEIPQDMPSGTYLSSTEVITATVDGMTQTGNIASDTLSILGAPRLTTAFTNDPVLPGETVTLEFTLSYDESATADATAISFSNNLTATLADLSALNLPQNDICGTGSQINGTSDLTFSGGSLSPGDSCTFSVTLQVPSTSAFGSHTNTTGNVTATVDGVTLTGNSAQDDLLISPLEFNKAFHNTPVIPGETVSLEFTLENKSLTADVTDIIFFDNLGTTLSGLTVFGPLPANPCGIGSQITGTTTLIFTGGHLLPQTSCTFTIDLLVPPSAAPDTYPGTTYLSQATINNTPLAMNQIAPATAELDVDNDKDNDGIMDLNDNCPELPNPTQTDNDGDGQGDACDSDDDNDTVPDTSDNCPFTANSDQDDFDGDGDGNSCDLDDDNDTLPDRWENDNGLNPYDFEDANWDSDSDGFTNLEEYEFGTDPSVFNSDENNNGVPDSIDAIRAALSPVRFLLKHN